MVLGALTGTRDGNLNQSLTSEGVPPLASAEPASKIDDKEVARVGILGLTRGISPYRTTVGCGDV